MEKWFSHYFIEQKNQEEEIYSNVLAPQVVFRLGFFQNTSPYVGQSLSKEQLGWAGMRTWSAIQQTNILCSWQQPVIMEYS